MVRAESTKLDTIITVVVMVSRHLKRTICNEYYLDNIKIFLYACSVGLIDIYIDTHVNRPQDSIAKIVLNAVMCLFWMLRTTFSVYMAE